MSLPIHSPLTTARPTTLAQAVAQARHPRNHATAQLEAHREELLRLAQAGESAESLVGGLRLIGIEIGRETLRRWLQDQLGRKPVRRRKRGMRPAPESTPVAALSTVAAPVSPVPSLPAPATFTSAPPAPPELRGADEPVLEGTSLILPGERPSEAFRRRLAARANEKPAAGPEPHGPRIARDDI